MSEHRTEVTGPRRAVRGERPEENAQHLRSDAGFSLVELIFAVVILAVGMLGLGGTTAYLARQATLADLQTERSAALITAVESVRATEYESISPTIDSVGQYEVRIYVTTAANAKNLTIVTTGPGLISDGTGMPILQAAVPDTFTYTVLRP